MHIQIRNKGFCFAGAPDMDTAVAAYFAGFDGGEVGPFAKAVDAAKAAAKLEFDAMINANCFSKGGRTAYVRAEWRGKNKPRGVMTRPAPVSWRARGVCSPPRSAWADTPDHRTEALKNAGCGHLVGKARRQALAILNRKCAADRRCLISALLSHTQANGTFTDEGKKWNFAG
jgi:hypothetical protein